jgi:hypothetical protein
MATVFSGLGSKPVATVFSSLASKLVATISLGLVSKPVVQVPYFGLKTKVGSFYQFGLKTGGGRFSGLGPKTGSYGLVIWVLKSLRQFLCLCLKTKQAMACRLRHKTDGRMRTTWGTCRDLTACFMWNQVKLGVFSLASRLVEAQRGWCMWHHRGGCVVVK